MSKLKCEFSQRAEPERSRHGDIHRQKTNKRQSNVRGLGAEDGYAVCTCSELYKRVFVRGFINREMVSRNVDRWGFVGM